MTRFVYVLPAGRFRWEVRVDWWRKVKPTARIRAGTRWRVEFGNADLRADGQDAQEHSGAGGPWVVPDDKNTYYLILPTSIFYRRKSRAMDAARAIAIVIGGEVQPHDRRGRIQDPDSFGGDSPRRRG